MDDSHCFTAMQNLKKLHLDTRMLQWMLCKRPDIAGKPSNTLKA